MNEQIAHTSICTCTWTPWTTNVPRKTKERKQQTSNRWSENNLWWRDGMSREWNRRGTQGKEDWWEQITDITSLHLGSLSGRTQLWQHIHIHIHRWLQEFSVVVCGILIYGALQHTLYSLDWKDLRGNGTDNRQRSTQTGKSSSVELLAKVEKL